MRVEVHTNGFEKTASVENFLNEAAGELVNEYLRTEGDVHIRVHVHEDRQRTQNRKPHFICEVQLKTAGSKKFYKSHKEGEDFKSAAQDAFHAMKSILQRRSDRRHDMKIVTSEGNPLSELTAPEEEENESREEFGS